jgi:hypothetical protein
LPIAFCSISLIHLFIKETDVDPEIRMQGWVRVKVRKMISHTHKYCNMLIDDDALLKGSIDDIKNADRYEEADEKEDDDKEDDAINIDALNDNE